MLTIDINETGYSDNPVAITIGNVLMREAAIHGLEMALPPRTLGGACGSSCNERDGPYGLIAKRSGVYEINCAKFQDVEQATIAIKRAMNAVYAMYRFAYASGFALCETHGHDVIKIARETEGW